MRLIAPNLRAVWANPGDHAAREAMMRGATLAGLAFSNASVALVHGMSRPIGAHFHVPHGMSNAMLLPAVTEYGLVAGQARYAEAARVMGLAGPGPGPGADEAAAAALLAELRAWNRDLEVPTPAGFGIDPARWRDLLPTMAAQALASGSPGNNPRVPEAAEIVALYESLFGA
jgi:alcohol dehydrogenase class IV